MNIINPLTHTVTVKRAIININNVLLKEEAQHATE